MKKWTPCGECKDKTPVKNLLGWFYLSDGKTVQECECHIKWRTEGLRLSQAQNNGVNLKLDYDPIKDYKDSKDLPKVQALMKYTNRDLKVDSWPVRNGMFHLSVYLHSKEVISHTQLLHWMAFELTKRGWNVALVSMRSLLDGLTPLSSFEEEDLNKSQSYQRKMLKVDFLFILEAFLPSEQSYRISYLDRFLMERLENLHRPTIFLSPTAIDSIAAKGLYSPTIQEAVAREIRRSGGLLALQSGHEVELGNIFGDLS